MERYFEINEKGRNIRCKLYCGDLHKIRRAVIFCTGFGGHKDNKAAEKFAERLLSKYKGTALVAFNWPCHGDDVRKKLCLEDCDGYLSSVIAYVKSRFQAEDLYAYATSFGGYLTLKYISEHGNPFKKVALRCPAVNMYGSLGERILSQEDWSRLQKGKDVPVGFDRKVLIGQGFLEELKKNDIREREFLEYAEDILILQGTADEVVSAEEGEKFAENNLIEYVPIDGADHRFQDPCKMEEAIKGILRFFAL